ncbi:hypothetical protein C8R47DRAFT_145458 [Mycena vitilis]|nr:hypothetical protein C8R47DRAFT_145458 [Mycena vitilis]
MDSVTAPYLVSARALMRRSTFLNWRRRLPGIQDRLIACESDTTKSSDGSAELKQVAEAFQFSPHMLVDLRLGVADYLSNTPLGELSFEFFESAAHWKSPPYRMASTLGISKPTRVTWCTMMTMARAASTGCPTPTWKRPPRESPTERVL